MALLEQRYYDDLGSESHAIHDFQGGRFPVKNADRRFFRNYRYVMCLCPGALGPIGAHVGSWPYRILPIGAVPLLCEAHSVHRKPVAFDTGAERRPRPTQPV